jgi:hypothetical protein
MEIISDDKLNVLSLLKILKNKEYPEVAMKTGKKKSLLLPVLIYLSVPVAFYLLWIIMFATLPYLQENAFKLKPVQTYPELVTDKNPVFSAKLFLDENRVKKLDKIYAKYSSRQPYLIVNTSDNTFTLFDNGKLVREGLCSTGSFVLLDAGGEQKWMFETPKGMMRIQGKTESPVWRKPDWAFIEEGLPVPKHHNSYERYEYGVLGDYALSIGNGYLIHGTLYQRLLGMPVTHGCVRLGDADLKQVFRTLRVGSKVYIF